MLAPNMEGTKPTLNRHPTHLLIANTHATIIGEAV